MPNIVNQIIMAAIRTKKLFIVQWLVVKSNQERPKQRKNVACLQHLSQIRKRLCVPLTEYIVELLTF